MGIKIFEYSFLGLKWFNSHRLENEKKKMVTGQYYVDLLDRFSAKLN